MAVEIPTPTGPARPDLCILETRVYRGPNVWSYNQAIHLVVDHNPDAHLAAFHLTPAIGSVSISTRIKMKRSTWVRALAQTSDGEIWGAYTKVAVTLNGCG